MIKYRLQDIMDVSLFTARSINCAQELFYFKGIHINKDVLDMYCIRPIWRNYRKWYVNIDVEKGVEEDVAKEKLVTDFFDLYENEFQDTFVEFFAYVDANVDYFDEMYNSKDKPFGKTVTSGINPINEQINPDLNSTKLAQGITGQTIREVTMNGVAWKKALQSYFTPQRKREYINRFSWLFTKIFNEDCEVYETDIDKNGRYLLEGYDIVNVNVQEDITETLDITSNGEYNVRDYAKANVNVPNPSTGKLDITQNGRYGVAEYEEVDVMVEPPLDTIDITENGIADVSEYKRANVNVSTGIKDSSFFHTIYYKNPSIYYRELNNYTLYKLSNLKITSTFAQPIDFYCVEEPNITLKVDEYISISYYGSPVNKIGNYNSSNETAYTLCIFFNTNSKMEYKLAIIKYTTDQTIEFVKWLDNEDIYQPYSTTIGNSSWHNMIKLFTLTNYVMPSIKISCDSQQEGTTNYTTELRTQQYSSDIALTNTKYQYCALNFSYYTYINYDGRIIYEVYQ